MGLSLDDNSSQYVIRAYEPGRIQVNDQWFTKSLLLYPHQLVSEDLPEVIDQLSRVHLERVLEDSVSVLLIGTGAQLIFPKVEVYADLLTRGIGVEIMDTRAACRTFQVLSAEGRTVAALLCIR